MNRQLPPLQRPKTLGGIAYFAVVACALVGLGLIAFASWRRGVATVGGGLLVAAVFRSFLGEYDAGMLRVRRRWFDVLALAAVGAALIGLAATIPNQPL